jgi:hypothetical protein
MAARRKRSGASEPPVAGRGAGTGGAMTADAYPSWMYYPTRTRPLHWARDLINVVAAVRHEVDTRRNHGLTSDKALLALQPGLKALGYSVETSKSRRDRLRRPVLFGANGAEIVAWEVDAVHDKLGVVVEVEAGRGARSNAVYRDLIRTSLIADAKYLALGVQLTYWHETKGRPVAVESFVDTKKILDAIYASGRLALPFEGVLLFGY